MEFDFQNCDHCQRGKIQMKVGNFLVIHLETGANTSIFMLDKCGEVRRQKKYDVKCITDSQ